MSAYVTPPLKVSNNIIHTPILCPNTSLLFLGHTRDSKKTYTKIFIEFIMCSYSYYVFIVIISIMALFIITPNWEQNGE